MKIRLTNKQFWTILKDNSGLFSKTADAIREEYGMEYSRQAVRDRALRNPKLLEEITEVNLDFAEGLLFDLMKSKKSEKIQIRATEFYLKTKGRNRGYIERSENAVIIKNSEECMTKEQIQVELDRIDKILQTKNQSENE